MRTQQKQFIQRLVSKLQTHLVIGEGQQQRKTKQNNNNKKNKTNQHLLIRVGRRGGRQCKSIQMPSLFGPSRRAVPLRTCPAQTAKAPSNDAISLATWWQTKERSSVIFLKDHRLTELSWQHSWKTFHRPLAKSQKTTSLNLLYWKNLTSQEDDEMVHVSKAMRTDDSPVPRDIARGRRNQDGFPCLRDHRWARSALGSHVLSILLSCQLIVTPGPSMVQ